MPIDAAVGVYDRGKTRDLPNPSRPIDAGLMAGIRSVLWTGVTERANSELKSARESDCQFRLSGVHSNRSQRESVSTIELEHRRVVAPGIERSSRATVTPYPNLAPLSVFWFGVTTVEVPRARSLPGAALAFFRPLHLAEIVRRGFEHDLIASWVN